ncbi:outer membrane protein [Legionella nagasakiensis]|uniref:outer membrane protein n=1 Tax=Legionella nagasakiensis TaxID=535290 RepID=UPI0010542027|nr:outer membrane beta-barrel protein [Legionella nagasakiensis]
MKNISKIMALCCVLPSIHVKAGTISTEVVQNNWKPIIGLSVAPSWANGGETQTFFLQPDIEKTYTANKDSSSFATGELFLGLQKNLNSNFIGQFGLAINATGNAGLSGDIWEDANPDFNNFTYNYKINHVGVAFKGRIIGFAERFLQPYISGSLGVGFNRAHDFFITPKIFEEVPAPNFRDNTKATFSYTLGAGIQKSLSPHWQAGIGYEFADWGRNNLARAPYQSLNEGLKLSHLHVQQLQFTIIYVT